MDRDARVIASNMEKTRRFMRQLYEEDEKHDPESWIALKLQGKYIGFVIATSAKTVD
ncbi:MAG: hypothetical protein NDF54_05540 [archaeon GB-1867-035]|nr:hypothetical protein [Candidatus Culexmicrobium profundum]